jgi:hypothetical protein
VVKPRRRKNSWPLCKVAPVTAPPELGICCPLSPSYGSCLPSSGIQGRLDGAERSFVELQHRLEELERERRLLSEVVGAMRGRFRVPPPSGSESLIFALRASRVDFGSSKQNPSARPSSSPRLTLRGDRAGGPKRRLLRRLERF